MPDKIRQETELELRPEPEFEPELELSKKEILTKIWSSPRLVFRYLNENHYDKFTLILFILSGIIVGFGRAFIQTIGDSTSLIGILALSILFGGLFGWIIYYIFTELISWTGKWLKGKGNRRSLFRVTAHAMIPAITALFILILQMVLFGNKLFQSDFNIYSYGTTSKILFFITVSLEFALGLWSLVLLLIGVSEVQKFSIGKAIFNLILSALILLLAFGLMILAIRFLNFEMEQISEGNFRRF